MDFGLCTYQPQYTASEKMGLENADRGPVPLMHYRGRLKSISDRRRKFATAEPGGTSAVRKLAEREELGSNLLH